MLGKKMDGKTSTCDNDGAKVLAHVRAQSEKIAEHYEKREFAKAINEIRALADEANRYFDEKAPWKTLEQNPTETKQVLTSTLNIFRCLAIYLKPILPKYCDKVQTLFNEKDYQWHNINHTIENVAINNYEHLATRIDSEKVKAMVEESKKIHATAAATTETANKTPQATDRNAANNETISIDDFAKVDLRVALVLEAEEIAEADKLLRLKVSLGPLGERQIIAGIKAAYKAEDLKGRQVLVVANLAPRKMKFGMSEGMVIAAGAGGKDIFVLSPDSGAKPGDKVK